MVGARHASFLSRQKKLSRRPLLYDDCEDFKLDTTYFEITVPEYTNKKKDRTIKLTHK